MSPSTHRATTLRGSGPPTTSQADSPFNRKRRTAALSGGLPSNPATGRRESLGSMISMGGISEQSSAQLQPTHSFIGGGMNLFGGFDDDLDNLAQYVNEEDDEEEKEEQEQEVRVRIGSLESDEDSEQRKSGMRLFLQRFDTRRKTKKLNGKTKTYQGQEPPQTYQFQPQSSHASPDHHHQEPPPPTLFPQTQPAPFRMKRPQPTLSKSRAPTSLVVPPGSSTEILCTSSPAKRSRSVPDYRTYNEPKSTLPKIGSFDLDIDTIPASPKMASVSPYTENADFEEVMEEDPTWKSSSIGTGTISVLGTDVSTAMVPYASGGVELIDNASHPAGNAAVLFSSINRQASWDRRLERSGVYHRHYVPSRQELDELEELEDYLGIFSGKIKHRFSAIWRQMVPPLDAARQRVGRRSTLQSQHSTSSVSTLSSVTNHHPPTLSSNVKSKTSFYSIILKRGPIQFEDYQDFHCEWILLTRGFVICRPSYQWIPRFQAGDMWTSVVQVQPTNSLSITLSCTSRSTSSHLTLTQLKQQQQYGCYTYEITCATPQEQASWLEALRRLVVEAHDSSGTNEKEMGGLGWQYRVVYVPFFTEAVTGNPVDKETVLAGSSGHVDLDRLDVYNNYTPLHYATRANHVRIMSFLLEAGADVHVGDGYGRTPMYYAELHQLPEAAIQLLESNGAQRTKLVSSAIDQEVWRKRNCQRKLFFVAMIFLLLSCATGALLWYFGILEPVGIGGKKSKNYSLDALSLTLDTTLTVETSLAPTADLPERPVVMPIPPIFTREISTPQPTQVQTYIKTPIPTPTNSRQSPTLTSPSTAAPVSMPVPAPTPAVYKTALLRLLESASFDAGKALRTPRSPQNDAFIWLSGNANLDSYTNSKKLQRYALATLYFSAGGDNWADSLGWLSDEDECLWFNKQIAAGYTVCEVNTSRNSQRTLTSLDLSFNNVQGTIPPELGLLSGLLRIDLDGGPSGFLSGPIPSELGYLNLIESFSARGNHLSGTLPTELGNWKLVRGIDLSYNKLTDDIPASFGSMTWLTELNLEINDFSGFLPPELGKLTNLFKLALGGNQISGALPSEIGFLTKLRYLYLEANLFSSLPTEVGLLENLAVLSVFENRLQGAIPSHLGGLKKLGTLLLRSNTFNASIPSEIGLMEQLQSNLDLSFNDLKGPIPSEIGKLTLLRSLYLQSNNLSGAIPNELSQLSHLNNFRLESNDIVGVVPVHLCAIFNTTYPNFYADCKGEVKCPCCTYCCTDGGSCACQHARTHQSYLC